MVKKRGKWACYIILRFLCKSLTHDVPNLTDQSVCVAYPGSAAMNKPYPENESMRAPRRRPGITGRNAPVAGRELPAATHPSPAGYVLSRCGVSDCGQPAAESDGGPSRTAELESAAALNLIIIISKLRFGWFSADTSRCNEKRERRIIDVPQTCERTSGGILAFHEVGGKVDQKILLHFIATFSRI